MIDIVSLSSQIVARYASGLTVISSSVDIDHDLIIFTVSGRRGRLTLTLRKIPELLEVLVEMRDSDMCPSSKVDSINLVTLLEENYETGQMIDNNIDVRL